MNFSVLKASTNAFQLGNYEAVGNTAQGFDGRMDSAFVFDRVLSASEITTLYNSGTGLSYSGL